MPARILIADDHEIVREGIRTLITRARPEWEICGEASNGEQAIEAVRNLKPDVVVLDITMPSMSGLEAATGIAKLAVGCRILMFTMHESERLALEVRQAGAQGFVLKSQGARDLIRAVDCLLGGGTFFGSGCEPQAGPEFMPGRPRLAESRGGLCFGRHGFKPRRISSIGLPE
jgi:DNA-binding NarL/FixJ family response regulator